MQSKAFEFTVSLYFYQSIEFFTGISYTFVHTICLVLVKVQMFIFA